MDVTASTITIVSSIWTLSLHCKRLLGGVKNSEERVKDLERKAASFGILVGQFKNAYGSLPADVAITPNKDKLLENVQHELSKCEEGLKAYEEEVKKLMSKRKSGRHGLEIIPNAWREEIANPIFERIEKFIADHHSYLQSLVDLHHGQKLQETLKEVKEVKQGLINIHRMFEEIAYRARLQGPNEQDNPSPTRIDMQRRNSEATLVNPPEDNETAEGLTVGGEKANPLHALAQQFFNTLLDSMPQNKGSTPIASGPSKDLIHPHVDGDDFIMQVASYLNPVLPNPPNTEYNYSERQYEKGLLGGKETENSVSLIPCDFREPEVPLSPLSSTTSPSTGQKRPVSPMFGTSTLIKTTSKISINSPGNGVTSEENKLQKSPGEGAVNRTNKVKGSELLEKIEKGSSEDFQKLLRSDASLEERDGKGRTPLILAASMNKADMVKQLLTHGANVHAVDKKNATALHNAAEKCAWPVMSLLLKSGNAQPQMLNPESSSIEVNAPDKIGRTPLHYCTLSTDADDNMRKAADELIFHKADIDARDKADKPPMYYAIKHRRYSVVQLFLAEGADLSFERPETSADIGKLLNDHIDGKMPSPVLNSAKRRKSSVRSQVDRKSSRFSFSRRSSSAKS